ncbi:methyltransferase, FkbM family protein [Cyanobium sp. PCC 7001]|nr:methyltransferase, FkbM family protein [Cyanobium sp. PCC 7001]
MSHHSYYLPGQVVLHIGANYGHEVSSYDAVGLRGYHVEAIPQVFSKLKQKCAKSKYQACVCACLSDAVGEKVVFNIAGNNAESSSMLPLGRHQLAYPHIQYTDSVELLTETVDHLRSTGVLPEMAHHLVIDVQGAELKVLSGATKLLQSEALQSVVVEASAEPLYEGGAAFSEVFSLLTRYGFYLREAKFNFHGWCDALFMRPWWPREAIQIQTSGTNIAPRAKCTQSSISPWSYGAQEAANVVQGRLNGSYAFHTLEEMHPWLTMDLQQEYDIHEILVYNRVVDGSDIAARAASLRTSISCDGEHWNVIHLSDRVFGGIDGFPLRVGCDGLRARYVRLDLAASKPQPLHLDTVEIYSTED